MKINLAAEDHDIKYNDPPGYLKVHFKCRENKTDKQEERINENSPIPKYHQRSFQPGKRQYLVGASQWFIMHFKIP